MYRRFFPGLALVYLGLTFLTASSFLLLGNRAVSLLSALGGALLAAGVTYFLLRPSIDKSYELVHEALPLARAGVTVEIVEETDIDFHFLQAVENSRSISFALSANSLRLETGMLRHVAWATRARANSRLLLSAPASQISGPMDDELEYFTRMMTRESQLAGANCRITNSPIGDTFAILDKVALVLVTPGVQPLIGTGLIIKMPLQSVMGDSWARAFEELWETSAQA